MNKICTSLEQSKKLIELGIDINTADNVIVLFGDREGTKTVVMPKETLDVIRTPFSDIREIIPAWSLTALLGLIPNSINFGYENDSIFILKKIENGNYIADYYEVSFVKDNPLDAAFEMIVWLKDNGKI